MRRRQFAVLPALALAAPAIAQSDQRPELRVAVQKISNSNTLETPREQSNVGFRLSTLFVEGLIGTGWTTDMRAVPELATAWRRVDDRTVEFDLRADVRMHDGRVMTAEDAAFSIGGARLYGSATPPEVVATARRTFPGFERMEIPREGVLRFVNRIPDVTLEGRLAQNVGVVVSQAAFEAAENWLAWARRPVGTGPYRVAEYRPDSSLTFEAHDAYWGGRPPARRVRVVEVPEVSSRVNALFSGEVDFITDMPPDQIPIIERNPRFEVLGSPINNIRILAFDAGHAVLRNPLVRRALTHAIDRRAIVDSLWAGRTEMPRGLQLPFFGDMYVADWESPRFDVAEARRLLREASYRGEPIPYRCLNNYYTGQTATAQVLVEMWRAAGLNVQLQMMENFSQISEPGPTRAIRDWSVTHTFGDPVGSLVRAMGPRGELQNQREWTNEEFNRLSATLESSTDRAERRAAHARMLTIIEREDPGYMVLHTAATFIGKRRDIRWRASQGWPLDFRASNLSFGA
ncbi:ABC transporter substrate-binding protein [Plastoroseomonas arctica]|uniref:ABC transporter substrate-binding protein n=1 Tax=Plastoroseomonas arctica TaxID=1509237 RepID=A0AAF1K3I4_9PROT|nr:ABC transporter substrate-binding protein [Plastoroseomonas arctica]MBR0655641.1 ABC transporter substrate-binding protein [Plastoroseomonas arctica]